MAELEAEVSAQDRDAVRFTVWLLGKLAIAWDVSTAEAYRLLQSERIVDEYILAFYEPLHTMGELALVEDITLLARNRGLAV